MHKGDYHTDYSKYYDKEYKDKDLAFEHVKKLKQELRGNGKEQSSGTNKVVRKKLIVAKKKRG